jgi:hypothetical protein
MIALPGFAPGPIAKLDGPLSQQRYSSELGDRCGSGLREAPPLMNVLWIKRLGATHLNYNLVERQFS